MATTTVTLTHARASDLKGRASDAPALQLAQLVRLLQGLSGHVYSGTAFTIGQDAASGTLTFATASGTVGGTINGVSLTFTASGVDADDAASFAALVNASTDPLVAGLVTATSALGVATVTATVAGPSGNAMTLAKVGTNVTASGARLTGGAADTYNL